ncbi:MAG: DUF1700 domain-containing protein [Anaerostipes sp.]|jgi:uncharacterized membrane protein|nr:DUF1700 domain-containing protein [Anaerostipes sp.]MDD3745601.1 DUF1700 domain-containing protein [Anaerostipes sp.]
MKKHEFIKELREVLDGQVPYSEVESSCQYYKEYIEQQVAGGRLEEEVLEELGSPRLIAKSIIDTKGGSKLHYEDEVYDDGNSYQEETSRKVYTIDSWVAKLGCLLAFIVALVIVGSLFAFVFKFIGPIIIVAIGIYAVMNIFGRR